MRKRLLVAFGIVMAGYAEQIPVTGGVTLSGQAVQVPGSLTARHSLLIIGFTAKSGAACNAWMKRVRPEVCASDSSAACYQIAVLASVPRLVRGLVLRAMKKGTDAQEQRSFLPILRKRKSGRELRVTRSRTTRMCLLSRVLGRWSGRRTGYPQKSGLRVCLRC